MRVVDTRGIDLDSLDVADGIQPIPVEDMSDAEREGRDLYFAYLRRTRRVKTLLAITAKGRSILNKRSK